MSAAGGRQGIGTSPEGGLLPFQLPASRQVPTSLGQAALRGPVRGRTCAVLRRQAARAGNRAASQATVAGEGGRLLLAPRFHSRYFVGLHILAFTIEGIDFRIVPLVMLRRVERRDRHGSGKPVRREPPRHVGRQVRFLLDSSAGRSSSRDERAGTLGVPAWAGPPDESYHAALTPQSVSSRPSICLHAAHFRYIC